MSPAVPRVAGPARLSAEEATPASWTSRSHELYRQGWWLEGIWGQGPPQGEVRALWGRRGELLLLQLPCPDGTFPSLTSLLPASDWFERALRDATGLAPRGHVDPRPFRFHGTYPAGYVDGMPLGALPVAAAAEYPFVRHEGEGVFEIPVGPIHAGIIEPGHLRFTTAGEIILDMEVRLNYTHKGTLALVRGKPVEHALRLLERLSGDNAAAHACTFAAACEAASGLEISEEVQRLRTAMVELERFACHTGDLAGIAVDVAFAACAARFQILREEAMRWSQRLFGHRLLMNTVAYGGLHRVPDAASWSAFQADIPRLARRLRQDLEVLVHHSGLRERAEGTGHLSPATAQLLGCVGPSARASGVPRDARTDHPALAYPGLPFSPVTRETGTVAGRMLVKADEARQCLAWLSGPLSTLPQGPSQTGEPGSGEGVALVEAPRGAVLSWVRLEGGKVLDVYQRDPSFLNWRGLEEAVHRNIIPDFPLINKSFNLSYSGSDA